MSKANSESKEKDSVNSEDASHDEAYNSIISSYYTTDPFFGANSGKMCSNYLINYFISNNFSYFLCLQTFLKQLVKKAKN